MWGTIGLLSCASHFLFRKVFPELVPIRLVVFLESRGWECRSRWAQTDHSLSQDFVAFTYFSLYLWNLIFTCLGASYLSLTFCETNLSFSCLAQSLVSLALYGLDLRPPCLDDQLADIAPASPLPPWMSALSLTFCDCQVNWVLFLHCLWCRIMAILFSFAKLVLPLCSVQSASTTLCHCLSFWCCYLLWVCAFF